MLLLREKFSVCCQQWSCDCWTLASEFSLFSTRLRCQIVLATFSQIQSDIQCIYLISLCFWYGYIWLWVEKSKKIIIYLYKITKIVRALWLAERSVCMRVCKHGCDVKMFCFSRANHASTNLKKFSSSKLDKFTLFTHFFVGWNLENRYKGVSILFRLDWHSKREKSVFWKASSGKTRTDYACKTWCARLCDW